MCAVTVLQDLRLLFDASGGGGRLNPIQLCALLQHTAKLAPAPELLTAAERTQLGTFASEVECCWCCYGCCAVQGNCGTVDVQSAVYVQQIRLLAILICTRNSASVQRTAHSTVLTLCLCPAAADGGMHAEDAAA
jgi:hypothetical protein